MFRKVNLYRTLTAVSAIALACTVTAQSAEPFAEGAQCSPHGPQMVYQTQLQGLIKETKRQNDTTESSRLLGIFARDAARILKAGACAAEFLSTVDITLLQDPIAMAILSDELDPLGRSLRDFEKQKR